MGSLLVYRYDQKSLISDTVELVSQYRSIALSEITSVRNIIKTMRNCSYLNKELVVDIAHQLLSREITNAEISALAGW